MNKILVIAPHPDDETLGCGGTLLKHRQAGDEINWLIVTGMHIEQGFTEAAIAQRKQEIDQVADAYEFSNVVELDFPCTQLDKVASSDLVQALGKVVNNIEPDILYLPWPGDAHSDHRIVFDAASACCKWFRYPSIKQILAYQTLSETEFGLNPAYPTFAANVFINISEQLDTKLDIMHLYASEMGEHPFPRSDATIRAQATLHGSNAGCTVAEAHRLLKDIR